MSTSSETQNSVQQVYLLGAGGHSKVVFDAIKHTPFDGQISILDGNPNRVGEVFVDGIKIALIEQADFDGVGVHVAIGDNRIRDKLYHQALSAGAVGYSVIHPNSQMALGAKVGAGSLVAAQAVIGPQALVGCGVIVNHGAVVDHDCEVGDFCHISPNATLGGGVTVGSHTLVGAGSVVLPYVSICADAVIGAGAVVTKNIDKPGVYVGAPAKLIKTL